VGFDFATPKLHMLKGVLLDRQSSREHNLRLARIAAANLPSAMPCAPKLMPPSSAVSIALRIAGCEWP